MAGGIRLLRVSGVDIHQQEDFNAFVSSGVALLPIVVALKNCIALNIFEL